MSGVKLRLSQHVTEGRAVQELYTVMAGIGREEEPWKNRAQKVRERPEQRKGNKGK